MKSIKKNKAPNVVSGTHYNLARFKELYSWINALQMDSISICHEPNQSGLLYFENLPKVKPLKLSGAELQLVQCCGVTRNGAMIGVFENNITIKPYDTNQLIDQGYYEILIGVDHVNRTAKGEADEDEVPFRQPYCDPTLNWDVFLKGKKEEKNFPNALKIGELHKDENGIKLLDFIPSCKNVGAHPDLIDKFNEYRQQFSNLLEDLQKILRLASNVSDPDMTSLEKVANSMGYYVASEKKVFEKGMNTSVFELFNFCKSFSNVLGFQFQSLTRQTQLMKMIEQNVQGSVEVAFTEQDFRTVVKNLNETPYDHCNIKNNLDVIDQFIEVVINRGFKLLGQRDELFPVSSGGGIQTTIKKKSSGMF